MNSGNIKTVVLMISNGVTSSIRDTTFLIGDELTLEKAIGFINPLDFEEYVIEQKLDTSITDGVRMYRWVNGEYIGMIEF
jgi:hypothetical protein